MKIMFTGIIAVILIFNSYAQETSEWNIVNEGKGHFTFIDFVSDDIGWIAGGSTVMKTEDGGETWNTISSEGKMSFIDFIDEFTGWAVCETRDTTGYVGRTIKKSSDGGNTWEDQSYDVVGFEPEELFVLNDSVLFSFNRDVIMKSVDGGSSWTDITPKVSELFFSSVWFTTPDTGFITCNSLTTSVLKTFDGGQTWKELLMPGLGGIDNLKFINNTTAYFIADNNYLYTTKDTFNTWTMILEHSQRICSYSVKDESTIFAVINDTLGWNGSFISSRDGGVTWTRMPNSTIGIFPTIYFYSSQIGYLISQIPSRILISYTNLYKSVDGGDNWHQKIFSYTFNDVWFINNNLGFVSGGWNRPFGHCSVAFGEIFMTNNSGLSWESNFETGFIEASYFLNDVIGFILSWKRRWGGDQGIISKTNDAGNNWFEVYKSNPDSLGYVFWGKDLCFMNDQTGWTVGGFEIGFWDTSGAAILGSGDGGETWNLVWKYPDPVDTYDYRLNSVAAIDTIAWAVGESGMMVKYSKENQWQLQPSVTDLPLNDVLFIDKQYGWIAGGYFNDQDFQSILLKTKDAGKNWTEKRFDKYLINDMFFADSLHGWAVGEDTMDSGMILETFDGGENWNPVIEGLSAPLNAIHFLDGIGWAVGGNGLILRTDNWTTWINQNTGEVYPSHFVLYQNYPNPFNPTTNIEFSIPKSEFVTLKVYNILGEEVATLVAERLTAGSYKYNWDASGFASGVYLYRIQAGNYVESRKMVMMK